MIQRTANGTHTLKEDTLNNLRFYDNTAMIDKG